ncbi:uncharacterized protein PITG_11480 [Phytophthora infestans T30-4]|uniref:Secreted RxLR effector peptide protein n=1 Tax=Phytophthora infestans (strain T30-4) TaxID=403677 RepID=D0NIV8_PHYIT|nr:uncharacterized protein PITG_11480 [Phytophthora infestans T30-4]EEY59442.1 hypothetical protein PITG_11480 [Phytophthora infestans T30-4]|eukprot:XP_002901052.1 hypothetical protein PITG_11480 [Phytophthora infestans T30-4]
MRLSFVFAAIAATFLASSDALKANQQLLRTDHTTDADFEERGAPYSEVKALAKSFGISLKQGGNNPTYYHSLDPSTLNEYQNQLYNLNKAYRKRENGRIKPAGS